MTKKGFAFKWDDEVEHSYNELKCAILKDPILIHQGFSRNSYLLTDASNDNIDSVLAHKIVSLYRPIAYYSVKMSNAQSKYPVMENEGWAIIQSVKHFLPVIEGVTIHILTDHLPVKPLLEKPSKAPSDRLRRWGLFLGCIKFTITYIKGIIIH